MEISLEEVIKTGGEIGIRGLEGTPWSNSRGKNFSLSSNGSARLEFYDSRSQTLGDTRPMNIQAMKGTMIGSFFAGPFNAVICNL